MEQKSKENIKNTKRQTENGPNKIETEMDK
jgi:hypothetical protein